MTKGVGLLAESNFSSMEWNLNPGITETTPNPKNNPNIRSRGTLPFYSEEKELTYQYCLTGDYVLEGDPIFDKASPEVKDLITQMLHVEPKNRISIEKALKHPWFNKKKMSENSKIPSKIDFTNYV